MNTNKKNILVLSALIVIIILTITVIFSNKEKHEEELSIVSNNIVVKNITRDERKDNAINITIKALQKKGLNVTKQDEIILDEAIGYNCLINGEKIEIYYLEPNKLRELITQNSNDFEKNITINNQSKKALIYNNIFILNCKSETLKQNINNALKQYQR